MLICVCVCTLYLFVVCVFAEIELNPPELTVMDHNLTVTSCVVRFNSSEPEPSIFFRYNEIWMTPGFNYTKQTSDGLSPPSKSLPFPVCRQKNVHRILDVCCGDPKNQW